MTFSFDLLIFLLMEWQKKRPALSRRKQEDNNFAFRDRKGAEKRASAIKYGKLAVSFEAFGVGGKVISVLRFCECDTYIGKKKYERGWKREVI